MLRLPLALVLAATALGSLCWIALLAGAGHVLHRQGYEAGEAGLIVLAALITL
jgi:membrane protein DedA with SNARE-associated domain